MKLNDLDHDDYNYVLLLIFEGCFFSQIAQDMTEVYRSFLPSPGIKLSQYHIWVRIARIYYSYFAFFNYMRS